MSVSGQKPARRSVSVTWVLALFSFLLVGFSAQVTAVTVSGLYTARVPVEGSSSRQLTQGYASGLSQVLVRVSGTRDVLAMDGVDALLSDAESLLLSYQVARSASGQSVLDMSFGAVGVNRALASIDAPVWGANRPLTLAWIAAEDRGARTLVTRSASGSELNASGRWQAAFDEAARKRGLPVALPPSGLASDRELLSDIWGQFIDRVKSASDDLDHDVLALVRVSRSGGQWRAGWVFDGMAMDAGEESVTAQSPEALAEAMINRWAEMYASRYAVAASEVGESPQVDIVLSGVTSLEDYAGANKVLEGLIPVVSVGAHRVRDEQLTLRVAFSGELDQLREYIALDPRFVPMESGVSAEPASTAGLATDQSGASATNTDAGPEGNETRAQEPGEQTASGVSGDGSVLTYQPVPVDEEEAREAFESLYQVLYYRWQPSSVIGSDGGE
ncbi:DUF2066 domain-containing protein [Marinobacter sp. F3R08]|uniref:DUF2066 domain-containing protein n=1 Tax=Marinobacter sp. F3R08 TaxID=2841559 RepID=UPI001C097E30|nr:DUF2066 domain-containing protein [Marinobacter sp. F3R08]MBU2955167.1 DUF2066 domain-containing protein [Marinobacter sp. F3R08]